jgi:hypothetical protein
MTNWNATISAYPASNYTNRSLKQVIQTGRNKMMLPFLRIKTIEKITAGLILVNLAIFAKLCLDFYFRF